MSRPEGVRLFERFRNNRQWRKHLRAEGPRALAPNAETAREIQRAQDTVVVSSTKDKESDQV